MCVFMLGILGFKMDECYIFVGVCGERVCLIYQSYLKIEIQSMLVQQTDEADCNRGSALKNAKCLHRRRIFRCDPNTRGMKYKHLTQPLIDFDCFFVHF